MKEYFVTSDVHSYYNILKRELDKSGFDLDNPNHFLIICGDCFDRGDESKELFSFLKSLGDRFIYVRGNHEDLLEQCYDELLNNEQSINLTHIQNGTLKTVSNITDITIAELLDGNYKNEILKKKLIPLLQFINKSVDYYEIGDNIFVHGWIPNIHRYEDLKKCTKEDWDRARWENGMLHWYENHRLENKTIFCGHWNSSFGNFYYHNEGTGQFSEDANYKPFVDSGVVALDACTAYSKQINIYKFQK